MAPSELGRRGFEPFDPALVSRYRLLSFQLLADGTAADRAGVRGVALGRDGLEILVERDGDDVRRALRFAQDLKILAIGPIVPSGDGGERIDAASRAWGTLGCEVEDAAGRRYGLTCDHVAGRFGGQKPGDAVFCASGTLGSFARGSTISTTSANRTDAALVDLAVQSGPRLTVPHYPGAPAGVNRALAIGDDVHKVGAGSGPRTGRYFYIVSLRVPYAAGSAWFVDQLGIVGHGSIFSQGGDSGAVVLDDRERVAGLLFASAPASRLGFANPIDDVEAELGVVVR